MDSILSTSHTTFRRTVVMADQMFEASSPSEPPEPEELSQLDRIRESVNKSVKEAKTLLNAMRAPLPNQTGDGTYLPQAEKHSAWKDVETIIRDIHREDIKKLQSLVQTLKDTEFGRPLNDREYLMESMVAAAAHIPDDFVQKAVTNSLVTTLWNDLEHPPQTLLTEKYQYRQPDGSHNSYKVPHIGAAGMPYAKTVAPQVMQSACLPDPSVVFDTVMARKNPKGESHPNYISSMLFYLASIIIHDLFRTNHTDYNVSDTSSYLDLSPLYGSTWQEQKQMRTFKDGKIKPDCFSETRLLTFPPGVGALLIMFNRHHNYVVEQLAAINEGDRFTENSKKPDVQRYGETINKRDDDLFQTGRLVTCGLYINIILIDYVRTILNLNRTDSDWQLNPRVDIPGGPPVGTGNQVSAEFNLVYRWHSAISEKDDKWTQKLFKELPLPPELKSPEAIAQPEGMKAFLGVLGKMEMELSQQDPQERQFPGLKEDRAKMERMKDGPYKGYYRDDDLADILTNGIEDCANAMGPQQVPVVMKAIEILGIQQARTWKCATLNEFRKHFSLTPHDTWDDITGNVEVQEALKHLYDTPDQVELYPGLVVEDAKEPKLPGSGLCPSYTVSRGVLSDAVALVRGDRFYTSAYTPSALTNWGYQESSSDVMIDNGCVFYKLFLRALPHNYHPASSYVHYPLTVPHEMQRILKDLDKDHMYHFERPKPIPQPKLVFSYDAAVKILEDQKTFNVSCGKTMEYLMGPAAKTFMLADDGPKNTASRKLMQTALYQGEPPRSMASGNEKWLREVREFYEETMTKLLEQKSYKLGITSQVDIIRDVGNLANVHFAAELFSLPLKTEEFLHGIFTEEQLYIILSAVFICSFFDLDPPKTLPLQRQAREATQQLGDILQLQVSSIMNVGKPLEMLLEAFKPTHHALKDYGYHMIEQLCKLDHNAADLVWGNIIGTCSIIVASQGQLFAQAMDYFFTEGKQYLPEINALAKKDTAEADDVLLHYLLEGARLRGEPGVFRRAEKDVIIVDHTEVLGTQTHHFKKGDKILVNLKAAGRDPKHFPNPDKLDLKRPVDSYILFGHGPHQCLGLPMTRVALTTMFKVVGRLDQLRPANVSVGGVTVPSQVKKVATEFSPGDKSKLPESWLYNVYLTADWDLYFPFPTSKFPPTHFLLLSL